MAGTLEAGDVLYEKGNISKIFDNPIKGLFVALIGDPGPFTHTGIAIDSENIIDSYPPNGVAIRNMKSHPASAAKWVRVRTGNSDLALNANFLNAVMDSKNMTFGKGQNGVYCSQFAGMVYSESSMDGMQGMGPNTQYYQLRQRYTQ